MDAVKAFMERSRMCKSHYGCEECPLNGKCGSCVDSLKDAKEALDIVEKWSKEHPIKTNGERFLDDNREYIRTYHRWDNGCKPYIEVHIEAGWWDEEYKEGEK